MCAWVQALISAIGNEVGTAGDLMNMGAQRDAANVNARRASMAAARAYRDGEQQAFAYNLDAGQRHSAQVAAAGGSGLSVTSGSFLDVMRGSRQASALDLAMTRANAGRAASQYLDQAADYKQQASALETSMLMSWLSSPFSAGGTMAQGISQSMREYKDNAPNTRQTDAATVSSSTANRPFMANKSGSLGVGQLSFDSSGFSFDSLNRQHSVSSAYNQSITGQYDRYFRGRH